MPDNLHTKLASLMLPLALAFFVQGASCGGGGANASANINVSASHTPDAGRVGAGGEANVSHSNQGESAAADGVARGLWGGEHVRLQVDEGGAEIEFDCAHGRMGKLTPDRRGDFGVEGVFVPERGGPVREEGREVSHPARYEGRVEGERMTLTVRVRIDGREQEPATYTLTHGRGARLTKCL